MKRTSLLASLLILGLILTVIAVNVNVGKADPASSISVEPAKITGKTGETFTVDFIATDLSDCYVWQIFVQYDTSILSYSRWWEGPYLKGNPALTLQSYAYYNHTNDLNLPSGPPNWGKLFDKNLITYSDFQYSEVDGFYTLYKFGVDPISTDSIIKRVDINMRYEAAASAGGDMYRIVYNTTFTAKKTLVDWTSDETSLSTYVWDDLEAPTADGWQWTEDVDGLCVSVETDRVGGDTSAVFKWYEVWLTIVYERPTTVNTDIKTSGVIFGGGIIGTYIGTYGSGLLGTMEFTVLSEGNTDIDIEGVIGTLHLTYYTHSTDPGIAVYVTTENGYFFEPWPEDVYPDGIIDIRDVAIVGINYGKTEGEPAVWVKSPSTWTNTAGNPWINPENVVSSDDTYAQVPKNGEETFSDYGFGSCASVTTVEVGVEGYTATGEEFIRIAVSNDGGSSWSGNHDVPVVASDTLTWVDVTSDFSWTPDMLLDASFKVRATGIASGGYKDTFVDWLPVRVSVIGPPEGDVDGDGDVDIMDLSMVAIKYGEIYL